ncbi:MAG: hypothetical protein ACFNZW_05450 [Coriobacteriaceae bacterium]
MYTLEEKTRAIELYVRYSRKATTTILELGYPSCVQLVAWYKEWEESGGRFS